MSYGNISKCKVYETCTALERLIPELSPRFFYNNGSDKYPYSLTDRHAIKEHLMAYVNNMLRAVEEQGEN